MCRKRMSGYFDIIQNAGDIFPESEKHDLAIWATDKTQSIRIGIGDNQGIILDYEMLTLNNNLSVWSVTSKFEGKDTDSAEFPSFTWQNSQNMGMYQHAVDKIGMGVEGIGKMFITPEGVGIGTDSPNQALHVEGTILAKSYGNISDLRFKDSITSINSQDALDKIEQLKGYQFVYKNDSSQSLRLGLIAQEVKDIVPECVDSTNPDMYIVAYSELVPLLIESVKELSKRIGVLERNQK